MLQIAHYLCAYLILLPHLFDGMQLLGATQLYYCQITCPPTTTINQKQSSTKYNTLNHNQLIQSLQTTITNALHGQLISSNRLQYHIELYKCECINNNNKLIKLYRVQLHQQLDQYYYINTDTHNIISGSISVHQYLSTHNLSLQSSILSCVLEFSTYTLQSMFDCSIGKIIINNAESQNCMFIQINSSNVISNNLIECVSIYNELYNTIIHHSNIAHISSYTINTTQYNQYHINQIPTGAHIALQCVDVVIRALNSTSSVAGTNVDKLQSSTNK